MRIPRVGKFKELAQNHRLWKYELKFSCIYHQGTDIPYTPAYPEKLNCDPEKIITCSNLQFMAFTMQFCYVIKFQKHMD